MKIYIERESLLVSWGLSVSKHACLSFLLVSSLLRAGLSPVLTYLLASNLAVVFLSIYYTIFLTIILKNISFLISLLCNVTIDVRQNKKKEE